MHSKLSAALLFTMGILLPFLTVGQSKDLFTFSSVHKVNERNSYSIFYPPSADLYEGIVVLIHSTQASNPKVYGNMINELLRDNFIVIYPAYQDYVVSDNSRDLEFISSSLISAYDDIKKNYAEVLNLPSIFIGHSKGGVLVFELASGKVDIPKMPSAVISLCPAEVTNHSLDDINFDKLDWYDVYLIIEEENDKYYKRGTGAEIFSNISEEARRRYIVHKKDDLGPSKHMNAWSYNSTYSSKNNTFLTYFNTPAGRTNAVDESFYWPRIKEALKCTVKREGCESFRLK